MSGEAAGTRQDVPPPEAGIDDSEDTRPPPTTGTPESGAWFKAQLAELEMSQSQFARWLRARGDDRKPQTVLRHIQRMAAGQARVSGEMRVILNMMRKGRRNALERQAAKAEATSQALEVPDDA